MEKKELGLSEVSLTKLGEIEDKILDFDDLEDRMDYVDELVIWGEFDDLTEGQEDLIDEYLRDFVMDTM